MPLQGQIEGEHYEILLRILAAAAGSRGMAGGQAIDLSSTGKDLSLPELEHMHIHKTGALIRAAVLLGAACGTALDPGGTANLDRFAKFAGLAFQVVDDLLDVQADTATLGKTAGKDAAAGKATMVAILGVERARSQAELLARQAAAHLEGFGERAKLLQMLASFVVTRRN